MNRAAIIASLAVGVVSYAQPPAEAPRPAPKRDVVLRWCDVTLYAIKTERTPPPVAARNLAIVHIAVYDAVAAIERGYRPFHVDARAPAGASAEAAAIAAAYRALVNLFPRQTATFNQALRASLAHLPAGQSTTDGIAVGESVARRVLEWRERDREAAQSDYRVTGGPGRWQPTPPEYRAPLLPEWTKVRPFALRDLTGIHPPSPPAPDSKEFMAAYREVFHLGAKNSRARTADETQIARFWADGEGTVTPPGHWNRIAGDVAEAARLSTLECARLLAMLNIALADAAIACWDCKFKFDYWRPVTAFRQSAPIKNSNLPVDPAWEPLLPTPPFPAYTSGHSTFSGAAAAVLAVFFGSDRVRFSTTADDMHGVVRRFDSFSAAAAEAGMSRIYGGIHWSFDNTVGLEGGKKVGQYVATNHFKRVE